MKLLMRGGFMTSLNGFEVTGSSKDRETAVMHSASANKSSQSAMMKARRVCVKSPGRLADCSSSDCKTRSCWDFSAASFGSLKDKITSLISPSSFNSSSTFENNYSTNIDLSPFELDSDDESTSSSAGFSSRHTYTRPSITLNSKATTNDANSAAVSDDEVDSHSTSPQSKVVFIPDPFRQEESY